MENTQPISAQKDYSRCRLNAAMLSLLSFPTAIFNTFSILINSNFNIIAGCVSVYLGAIRQVLFTQFTH